jgi:flagellar M-ring protein FliF
MALQDQQSVGNFLQRFSALPNSRKFGVVVAFAAFLSLLVGLTLWAQTPDYRVLFSNLSEKDGGAVITALQQMNVPYKMQAGGAIMVPADQVYDMRFRLASQGLPRGGAVGFELMDSNKLGMTQFQEQVTYQRALEGELARTIQSLAPVEAARVHLAIPKPSVFIREQQKPSASVFVNLYAGRTLDNPQVNSIVHLVSSSVPELSPSHITVVDQAGNLLSSKADTSSLKALTSNQMDYLRELEAYYSKRVEAIVAPIVGAGNVKAEVRADLDFSESEFTSESFKPNPSPETQAIRSQQSLQDTSGGAGAAGGVPGAFSNQPPGAATAPFTAPPGANAGAVTPPGAAGAGAAAGQVSAGGGSSRQESTVNYELDKTIRHVREPLGRIKRVSVAVVVNYRASAEPEASPTPLAPQELEQIGNLVREAVGYNQARGDTVNVVNAAFTEVKREILEVPLWKDPENISLAKEILKNLLVFGLAFYLVFGVLKPLLKDLMKPVEAALPEGGGIAGMEASLGEMPPSAAMPAQAASYQNQIQHTREFAKQNPKVVAEVVKEWMAKE